MSDRVRQGYKTRKEIADRKSVYRKFKDHTKLVTHIGRGDWWSGAAHLYNNFGQLKDPLAAMVKQKRRVRRQRRGGRRRSTPASLRPLKLPIRRVIAYEATSGSAHRWYYPIPLSLIIASLRDTFDEFKVANMTVRYVPNNSLNETGLYTSTLLDREGFGSFGTATAASWFAYIASMPGASIKPRHTPTSHRWRPTEPSARDWVRRDPSSGHILATIYICNNGKETDELGGLLEITASLLVRGRYWNAAVKLATMPHPPPPSDDGPPSPVKLSRCSSATSLIGGFSVL